MHLRDGTVVRDPRLGRLVDPDAQDRQFPVLAELPRLTSERTWRYWWSAGWWGDQGATSQCVAYAWLHCLADGPANVRPAPVIPALTLYCACQRGDQWAGDCETPPFYDGTSVRAGAGALVREGVIRGYHWAFTVHEVTRTLLERGPVVLGTAWHRDMMETDGHGFITPTGPVFGGHAYVLNGVNLDRGVVRVKNSWGREWGRRGYAWLRLADLGTLLAGDGEACVPDLVV